MFERGNFDRLENASASFARPKYDDEWNEICRVSESGLSCVKQYVVHMGLQGSRFRSLVWQLLLKTLPPSPSLWVSVLRLQRHNYRLLRQKFTVDPHCTDSDDNPLSQSSASKWHQYFCDKELRSMIRQDVVRAFPGVEFFRSESIQSTMVNILFCYARQHPETCYRQGMHEVLAPVIFVLHCDQQSLLHAQEASCLSVQAVEILDPTCLEEDAFWLFTTLMGHLASSYHVKDMTPSITGYFSPATSFRKKEIPGASESEVASRLKWIRDNLLSHFDPDLYQHVMNLDIPFQTFGIRWLRVLFGQEFPLVDLLHLWDAIFAEEDDFDLVNYIVVAMLSAIREELLCRDDNDCLMLLMRYPSGVSVHSVIELALHMRKPERYPSPSRSQSNNEKQISTVPTPKNTLSGRFKQFTQWSQRKGSPPSDSSSPLSASSANLPISRPEQSDGRQGIIEGYILNDPTVIKAELQHYQTILLLVHSHLERYHITLENTLPPSIPQSARSALAGIKELCVQLRHALPTSSSTAEVEAASEAEPAPVNSSSQASARPRDTHAHSTKTVSAPLHIDCPMKEIKMCEGIKPKSHFPLDDPLQALRNIPCEKDLEKHVLYRRILGACLN